MIGENPLAFSHSGIAKVSHLLPFHHFKVHGGKLDGIGNGLPAAIVTLTMRAPDLLAAQPQGNTQLSTAVRAGCEFVDHGLTVNGFVRRGTDLMRLGYTILGPCGQQIPSKNVVEHEDLLVRSNTIPLSPLDPQQGASTCDC